MSDTTSIFIPKGTTVFLITASGTPVPVTLAADAYIDEATRHDDGCYGYCVAGRCYVASAGTACVLSD